MGLLGLVDGKLLGFDEAGSREAPLGMSPEGRNNISGASYLYVSDSAETACAEVKPTITHILSVAEFKVKEPLNIIDFSEKPRFDANDEEIDFNMDTLFGLIMEQYFLPVVDPIEYKATQIITDHIRKTGIDGIAYRSFYNKTGKNYTIFNSDRKRLEFMGSRIVSLQNEERSFWDFNNKGIITAQSIGPGKYDQKTSDKMMEIIDRMLHRPINE